LAQFPASEISVSSTAGRRFTALILNNEGQLTYCMALFIPEFTLNSTMQKEDSPSHQNAGTYMKY
jgi:hypothetical protein